MQDFDKYIEQDFIQKIIQLSNRCMSDKIPNWSLEILPHHVSEVQGLPQWVEEIYVTMIPGSEISEVVEASAQLVDEGRTPIPHIAARGMESREQFSEMLESLKQKGVNRLLLIGGGEEEQQGPFTEVMDLMETGELQRIGFEEIGIAGHPEGNPSDPDAENSLLKKTRWATKQGISTRIVTQWCFESQTLNRWINNLHEQGVTNPIHIGIPGPATLKTLLRYAQVCGVKASSEVLKKQGFNLGKLLFVNKPDRLVQEIRGHQQLHLFPFGGLTKSSEWLQQQRNLASTA